MRHFKSPSMNNRNTSGFGNPLGNQKFTGKPTLHKNMNKPFWKRLASWLKGE